MVLSAIKDFFLDTNAQQKVENNFAGAVDSVYGGIGSIFSGAVNFLEGSATQTLNSPIKFLSEAKFTRYEIDEDKPSILKQTANGLMAYHEATFQFSDVASRVAGSAAHAITRIALFFLIRFPAKILNLEPVGALIQNSVAAFVGFTVRAIFLATLQLGHLAPYVVVGGFVAGLVALGHFVSPLAAVGVAAAIVILVQQLQIHALSKKVDDLRDELNKVKEKPKTSPSIFSRLYNKLPSLKTVGKVGLGILTLGGLSYAGYQYQEQIKEFAKPVTDFVSGKFNDFVAFANSYSNEVSASSFSWYNPFASK